MPTPTIEAQQMYAYQSAAAGVRTVMAMAADGTGTTTTTNKVVYWDANGNAQVIFTPSLNANNIRAVFSNDYAYFEDGLFSDLQKWSFGVGLSKWGVSAPVAPLTVGAPSAGLVTLQTGRSYYVAFYNNAVNNYSDLSPISASTGPATLSQFPLSAIPVSTDPQVTNKVILATADGNSPTTLYFLTSITNATTTYTDNTPTNVLLFNNVFQFTDSEGTPHGIVGNQPPPNGSFPTKHRGRIYMAAGENLFFSKSLSDLVTATGTIAGRFEEAWPPTNVIDVSGQAEVVRGLLSNGTTLYIGTEVHIHQLTGDSPLNFAEQSVAFPNTGLMTQNVWQIVYIENTPVGTIWVTPDYKCLGSDFNTYENIGKYIQTTLNTINPNAINNCWALSVSLGPYDFYVLAICTGTNTVPDTFCVFDMHLRKWYIWQGADQFSSGLFYVSLAGVPRWLVSDANGFIRNFSPTFVQDRATDPTPVNITSTIQTSWLGLGDPLARDAINQIEFVTTDPSLQVTVFGATNQSDLLNPTNQIVSNANLVTDLFGDFKLPLTGTNTVNRLYKLKVQSTSVNGGSYQVSTSNGNNAAPTISSITTAKPNEIALVGIGQYGVENVPSGFTLPAGWLGNTQYLNIPNALMGGFAYQNFNTLGSTVNLAATAPISAPWTTAATTFYSVNGAIPAAQTQSGTSGKNVTSISVSPVPFFNATLYAVAVTALSGPTLSVNTTSLGNGPFTMSSHIDDGTTQTAIFWAPVTKLGDGFTSDIVTVSSSASTSMTMWLLQVSNITFASKPSDVILGEYIVDVAPIDRY